MDSSPPVKNETFLPEASYLSSSKHQHRWSRRVSTAAAMFVLWLPGSDDMVNPAM